MAKKFTLSLIFVLFSLFMLKVGVDVCLPYRGSAFFPMSANRENFVCQALNSWDQTGRIKRTRIFEVLTVPMSQMDKDAINPSTVGWGDLLLFWRVPLILPLILEQVPEYSISTVKVLCFAFSSSLFLAIILHYIALIYKASTEGTNPRKRLDKRTQADERVTSLMGRSNASNNIIPTKRRGQ